MATPLGLDGDPLAGLGRPHPVGLLYSDPFGKCVSANTQWCNLVGCSLEGPRGHEWLDVFPYEERERMQEWWEASTPKEFSRDSQLLLRCGSVRKVRLEGLPIVKGDHVTVGFILAIGDPSVGHPGEDSQEETARALRERVRELHCLHEIRRIVERTGGMSIRDIVEGTVKILPSSLPHPEIAFARIILDGEYFGTCPETTSPPWMERAYIKVHGETAGSVELGYLEMPPSEGDSIPIEERRTLLDSVAQRLGRMVERIKAVERLQEKDEQLRATVTHMTRVAIVGEMAANIAHELNQPLAAITSFAEASRRILNGEETDFEKLSQALTWIAEEALRAGEIIQQMGNLVKKREARHEVLDLNEVIRSVEHLGSTFARLNRVHLALELDPDLPPVRGDETQVQQVLLNLIRNGVAAAREGNSGEGRVIVRSENPGSGDVQVSVEDNGCGLSLEREEEVFRPFSGTKESGMGLGLSISKSIVTAHGGRIGYFPLSERGTLFFFTVPTLDIR